MLFPTSEQQFSDLKKQGFNRIPFIIEALADLDTPLSLYLKLANEPYSYLLESVDKGERFSSGRYSIIGLPAVMRVEVKNDIVTVWEAEKIKEQYSHINPLDFIRSYLSRFKVARLKNMTSFLGGLVGYLGYETVRYIEDRLSQKTLTDKIDIPDILLMLSERIAVIDNFSGKLYLIIYANTENETAYEDTLVAIKEFMQKLHAPVSVPKELGFQQEKFEFEFEQDEFKEAVELAKRHITAGDIMQVVLSQRINCAYPASPLSLYRTLRGINPSPYMFYYNMKDHYIVGASPEILVRLREDTIIVRPIAGTRPRGKTTEKDIALEKELLNDEKERAEHLQLIDLGRNDIGRVAEIGSVKVTQTMAVDRYSHVMHMVSNIEGKLKPNLDAIDVIKATFPAGTVSGAPKIKAMEIINNLEKNKRGIYSGAVGYLAFHGDMDMAIAIRTGLIKNEKLYVQSGAGIVTDSIPENEWIETQNKAKSVLRAAELVANGFNDKI